MLRVDMRPTLLTVPHFILLLFLTTSAALAHETLPGVYSRVERSGNSTTALLSVEFLGRCSPPTVPSALGDIVSSVGQEQGLMMVTLGQAPLVSREAIEYSVVRSVGNVSHATGRLYMEAGPGAELTLKTDKGEDAVVKVDLKSVCWDTDHQACMLKAKEAKAVQMLLAKVQAEDLTNSMSSELRLRLGNQRSVRVSLSLSLADLETGEIRGTYSKERRQMDISVQGAVDEAMRILTTDGLTHLKKKGAF